MDSKRNLSDILLLLLLPAPLTGIALIMVSVYIIGSGTGDSAATSAASEDQPATLSADAILIATVNAAPERQAPPAPVSAEMEVALAAYDPAMVDAGRRDFLGICSACHGTDARGISGLGKGMLGSEFVRGLSDEELLQFITVGRDIWDPLNTTGVQMPARGGNPGLTDDSIRNIIAYIRTLDGFAPSAGAGAGTASSAAPEAAPAEANAAPEPTTDPADLDTSFTPIDTSGLAGLAPTSPEGEAEAVEPAAEGRSGEALYAEICQTNVPLCDYLLASVSAGIADADLTAQLTNGLSAFAAGNTSGVNIPAGGGLFPPMTAAEIEALISHVKVEAGIETEAAPAETEAETVPASDGRTGQALSDALCSTNAPLCDYLREQLAAGTPQADLAAQLVNGLSMFAAGNTSGINIPAGGGLFPPMTEGEVNTLLEFLSTQ